MLRWLIGYPCQIVTARHITLPNEHLKYWYEDFISITQVSMSKGSFAKTPTFYMYLV